MIQPGKIYLADFEEMEPHPVVVVSREELNRGNWVAAVLITSKRFEERSKQPHCVPFRAGEFGLSKDCVASDEFNHNNLDVGYREVLRLAGELRDPNFDPFQVKLIKPGHPLAKAALDVLQRFPGRMATRLHRRNFGGVSVDEVYIYPTPIAVS